MQAPNLPEAPFPVEQLQDDICTIFLLERRKIGTLTEGGADAIQWQFLQNHTDLYSPQTKASEILNFDQIKFSAFAQSMLDHYDFGFHALTHPNGQWEDKKWLGAYLIDLNDSAYANEWDYFGASDLSDAIQRCLQTIEMSNARCLLEGYEPFCHFSKKGDDDSAPQGEMTIRQLAMLANMEEMSLRSIISRKTPPILETRKHNRSTLIDAAVAREWLKAKGYYLPVKFSPKNTNINLIRTEFSSLHELTLALKEHLDVLLHQDSAVKDRLSGVLACHHRTELNDLEDQDFSSESLMEDIAIVLSLPAKWLIYKARQTYIKHLQREIEIQTKKLILFNPNRDLDSE